MSTAAGHGPLWAPVVRARQALWEGPLTALPRLQLWKDPEWAPRTPVASHEAPLHSCPSSKPQGGEAEKETRQSEWRLQLSPFFAGLLRDSRNNQETLWG